MRRIIVLILCCIIISCASGKALKNESPVIDQTQHEQSKVSASEVLKDPSERVFEFSGHKIAFNIPGEKIWKAAQKRVPRRGSQGIVVLKRKVIIDDKGNKIIPNIGITLTKLSDKTTFNEFAVLNMSMMMQNAKIVKFVENSEYLLSIEQAAITYFKYSYGGIDHKVIFSQMMYENIGIVVICDATDGVFDEVEGEFKEFIKSINIKK